MANPIATSLFRSPLLSPIARRAVRATAGRIPYDVKFLVDSMAVERPNYAYCLFGAANLARALGIPRISALEFGVAGGNGLRFLCSFSKEVEKATGVGIDCYGFDTGAGMPPPEGPKNLPYWFKRSNTAWTSRRCKRACPMPSLSSATSVIRSETSSRSINLLRSARS